MTELLKQAKERYGAEIEEKNLLGNSANLIYEIAIGKEPAILRFSKYSPGKLDHVKLELSWMQYLMQTMTEIAGPIPSKRGNLHELIEGEEGRWIACAFHRAAGKIPDLANEGEWNQELFRCVGEVMGKMHTITKAYVSNTCIDEELDWRHNYLFWPENNLWSDPDIQPIWEQVLAEMEGLPRQAGDYGLVHTDIHYLNFHIQDGSIILFDFDDCAYSWYAYDIASTLFFMAGTGDYHDPESGKRALENFAAPFLQGYQKHAALPTHWADMVPLFLRYRRLGQYKYFFNRFHEQAHPYEEYLAWAKNDILHGFRYLQCDFRCFFQ